MLGAKAKEIFDELVKVGLDSDKAAARAIREGEVYVEAVKEAMAYNGAASIFADKDGDISGDGDDSCTPLCNVRDNLFGWTPLFLAVIELRADAVECLLEGGANPNLKDDLGDTCLDCVMKKAKGTKRAEIRSLLKEYMEGEEGADFSSESESEEEESGSCEDDSDKD